MVLNHVFIIPGPCWHDESLENMCKEITGDIPLHTLVKGNDLVVQVLPSNTMNFVWLTCFLLLTSGEVCLLNDT